MPAPQTRSHKFEVRRTFQVINQGPDGPREITLEKGSIFTATVRTHVDKLVEMQDFVVEPDGVLFTIPVNLSNIPCSHTRFLDADPEIAGSDDLATGCNMDGLC